MTLAPNRLRQWRTDIGMGAADVAKLLDCNPSYVSLLEGGQRVPSLRLAARIQRLTARWPRGPIMAAEWVRDGRASEAA